VGDEKIKRQSISMTWHTYLATAEKTKFQRKASYSPRQAHVNWRRTESWKDRNVGYSERLDEILAAVGAGYWKDCGRAGVDISGQPEATFQLHSPSEWCQCNPNLRLGDVPTLYTHSSLRRIMVKREFIHTLVAMPETQASPPSLSPVMLHNSVN